MKKVYLYFLLILLITVFTRSQGLYDAASGNGSTVIACGKNGIAIRSTNSGNSWASNIIASYDLHSVHANSQIYWIAGNNGVYLKSIDGGLNWSMQVLASGVNLRSIYFADVNTGWIAGFAGTILKTTNGGNNWITQNSGTSADLNCIKFSGSDTGFACGKNGTVLRTLNGGTNWQLLSTPSVRELLSIDVKGSSVITSGVYSTALRSADLGNTWVSMDYKHLTLSDINSVFMLSENDFFSCGGGGFVRRSTDGGSSFTFGLNPMFGDLYSLFFYDSNTGWAVSRKTYAVIRTSDGGGTWHLPAGTNVSYTWQRTLQYGFNQTFGDAITTFNPFNKDVLYTLVTNKLYRSSNLGVNWNQISTLPFAAVFSQFLAISPYDTSKIIAVLQQPGRVFYTSNYGADWINTYSGNIGGVGIPVEVSPRNPDTLYLGTSNLLYRSSNFGLNWTFVSGLPYNYGTCDIEISYSDPNLMNVCTRIPARVYKSTNSGINFSLMNSDTAEYGESPAMYTNPYNTDLIYHLFFGTAGKDGVWKSTNFGSSWSRILNLPYTWGIATACDDPNLIVAGVWDNVQRPASISTNGGSNFFQTSPISNVYSGNETMYAYDRGNIFAQQTDGIFKLNVIYDVPAIGIEPISSQVPDKFRLFNNYPNPFNPMTKLKFQIPKSEFVKLAVFDVTGREIVILVNEELKPGTYEINWNAANYPSGVYFYSVTAGGFTQTSKMILLK